MVALVVGLGAAVVYEHSRVHCLQTSISAYYYTPVHGVFIGALLAIGVCLLCLQGSTVLENVFLNLAGMFAPMVALVPISDAGKCGAIFGTTDRNLSIANNVRALLLVELLALLLVGYLGRHERANRTRLIGYVAGVAVWLVATVVFFADRKLFVSAAHLTAASLMFGLVIGVVIINAVAYKEREESDSLRNKYTGIAFTMVAVTAVVIAAGKLGGFDHWAIVVESALILLFAAFWGLQTAHLWHEGLWPSARSR